MILVYFRLEEILKTGEDPREVFHLVGIIRLGALYWAFINF
jgi:hypothetical protein